MEPPVVRPRGRPRKRRRNDLENDVNDRKTEPDLKKRDVETTPAALMGRYVLKEFKGSGIFLGKVVFYEEGLYRVVYEDGDSEDLESREIRRLLLDDRYFDDDLSNRRKNLDKLALKLSEKSTNGLEKNVAELGGVDKGKVGIATVGELSRERTIEIGGDQSDLDADSSSDSGEYSHHRDLSFEAERPKTFQIPPPQLPPSSGTIGIPEQYVSHLFAVYGFLRSFSTRLFLFPFSLDDFVGSLNCCVPNMLLDAVHVALMRALHHYLETLSSDGSERASRCLRCIDWSLLDTFTWPVYLVQYLTFMGSAKAWDWSGFYDKVLHREYYSLPAGIKLLVLQILCDDVLDSAELRAEIDMREESEIGSDFDADEADLSENGPRRVHPKYPKTSACKSEEAMEITIENHGMKSSSNPNLLGLKGTKGDMDVIDVNRNSDECQLCGMDGFLLCCDGCPSAYHSRCIGVMKMFIPDGPWYCPECSINKIGPTIAKGTSLRGAEIFGIDSHQQIFLGSCNHLVVLKASIDTEQCLRYYNQNDIQKVLHVLCSSVQYTSLYSSICKAIINYWDILESLFSLPESTGKDICLANFEKNVDIFNQILPEKGNHKVSYGEAGKDVISVQESSEALAMTSADNIVTIPQECMHLNMLSEGIKNESTMACSSVSQPASSSDVGQQCMTERSGWMDPATCTSGNSNASYGNDTCLPEKFMGHEKGDVNSILDCVYMGSKPPAYINHYMHGEFAASAAAKLAVLSSEDSRGSEVHASDNSRKTTSAINLLQAKAFSLTASRFFWPVSEKKLMEVPRERCGWCLSCKASVASKRGCMLNHAALSATKAAMKVFTNLRPIKNGEGSLPSIVAYILYMEESLSGLVVGPFLRASYRKKWRQQIEQASTCSIIRSLLLELEQNIRIITLSGDWFKLVEDCCLEPSLIQNTVCTVTTSQKRGPSGRKNKKQSVISDVASDDSRHNTSFVWWRGKLSKHSFQRAVLPGMVVKRAARQGGSRKIVGIYYSDGSEIPKRTRQYAWRAAVEMSKNASQLALQVRYLDFHVRWSDLARPEQTLQEAKGLETEASAFRNASISDKKVVENKITYGVAFGNQKHLPSRVMKNVLEIDQCRDGKDKYWFSESHIPLYLVKEYEESLDKLLLPAAVEPENPLSSSQQSRLKSFCRDIFFYLTCRRDNLSLCSCSSCQKDVLIGNAVRCSACQGYCHRQCTVGSAFSTIEEAEFLITCKKCYHPKTRTQSENSTESPTSPLPLQGQGCHSLVPVNNGGRPKGFNQPSASVKTPSTHPHSKQSASISSSVTKSKKRCCNWGIIWKKKNNEDTSNNFRLNYILLKGGSGAHHLNPVCHLCRKTYRSDLMYICCETCKNWYHAEAVELEESKIFDVMGFKCCRCRRIKSPECPYMDPKDKKQESRRIRTKALKQENVADSDSAALYESTECEPNIPLFDGQEESKQEDDPLLFSLARVEVITEPNSDVDTDWNAALGPVPQKLPVRRHTKYVEDSNGFPGSSLSHPVSTTPYETNNHLLKTTGKSASPEEWNNASTYNLDGEVEFDDYALNYEDMEFEPQTYFSFTELLAPDDIGLDTTDASRDMTGEWDNSFPAISSDGKIEDMISIPVVNCQICSETEPVPDLSCKNCGITIHNQCSPWGDSIPWEDNWSCGHCREWR